MRDILLLFIGLDPVLSISTIDFFGVLCYNESIIIWGCSLKVTTFERSPFFLGGIKMKNNNVLSIVFIYAGSTILGALIGLFIVCMMNARDAEKKDISLGVQGDLVAKAVDDVGPGTLYGDYGDLKRTDNLSIVRKAVYQVDSPWDLSLKEYEVIKLYLRHVLDEIDPTPTPTR